MNDEVSPLDTHFAALMVKLNGQPNAELESAALAVSAQRAEGHICVSLKELGLDARRLGQAQVVGAPGEFKPLILDPAGRLYLHRYYTYESELATAIRTRLGPAEYAEAILTRGLAELFPGLPADDGQRVAAETAVRKKFSVITGGPGTGKTYTVARLLALLAEQHQPLRVALAAPTGKAAARMQESLTQSLAKLPNGEALRALLPDEVSTIHRLLGTIPGSPYFRHDDARPLAVDVVVVDEASMIDLALMAKLFAAVPPSARIVLLGDKDQLASVEAGNVLGDICNTAGRARSTQAIAGHIVELSKTHRFTEGSGIGRLSALVNAGNTAGALTLLEKISSDLHHAPTPAGNALEATLRPKIVEGFHLFLEATDPREALEKLGAFRVLCATRRGPHGIENINRLAVRTLTAAGLIAPEGEQYHGRPVLITVNDYQLRLFNGDVGLILRDPDANGELRAFLIDSTGALRRVLPSRLPAHETCFAMTVHKSQGSEFDRILLILPDRDVPIATRELLYTGITRAKSAVELWANETVLRAAIGRQTQRSSGLREALWGTDAVTAPPALVQSELPGF